jgi:Rieske Fe-S protein
MYRADGERFAGPAPRNLAWLTVSLAPDGQIVIDTAPSRVVSPDEVLKV